MYNFSLYVSVFTTRFDVDITNEKLCTITLKHNRALNTGVYIYCKPVR